MPSIHLRAYTRAARVGVTLEATLTLVDHEDDSGDLTETAREAFRAAMGAIWDTTPDSVDVYTGAEEEAYFLRGD